MAWSKLDESRGIAEPGLGHIGDHFSSMWWNIDLACHLSWSKQQYEFRTNSTVEPNILRRDSHKTFRRFHQRGF
jgi:hypothetical protein